MRDVKTSRVQGVTPAFQTLESAQLFFLFLIETNCNRRVKWELNAQDQVEKEQRKFLWLVLSGENISGEATC